MSLEGTSSNIKHFPKNPEKFEFDDEVSKVFDQMAARSIPMYEEIHRLHLSMLQSRLVPGAVVVDVGASTGMLFRTAYNIFGRSLAELGVTSYAMDPSESMLSRLKFDHPYVRTIAAGLPDTADLPDRADLMFCFYVLQFIAKHQRLASLEWMYRNMKTGGVLVLGQKSEQADDWIEDVMREEYYKFRRDHGYTQEEIDRKTAALKNSMWPVQHSALVEELHTVGFRGVYTTSQWLQFGTVIAVK